MTQPTSASQAIDDLDLAYRDSLDWLFRQRRGNETRDPSRMARLVGALGLDFPARSVHVVGTNGKGTVTAMCAAALTATGRRSGSFTSPHVEDFRERINVDGVSISKSEVVEFVELVRGTTLPLAPAFFELTLALALRHFERSGVDFAAFEAGVGARHDATAVLERVAAVAITPISLDHLETLGPTLADITRDKAAAIRTGVPVASARQEQQVLEVLREEAARKFSVIHVDAPGAVLFERPARAPAEEDPVRRANARLAAATLRLLEDVPEDAVAAGVAIPPLPGRGERFRVGETVVLLDGAHDPAAGRALSQRAGREYILVFGSLRRKQGEATLRTLETRSLGTFVTSAGGEEISVVSSPSRTFVTDSRQALLAALRACPPGGLVVVGGSLYLAGELRPLLRELSANAKVSAAEVDR